jgi:hypothetical protein
VSAAAALAAAAMLAGAPVPQLVARVQATPACEVEVGGRRFVPAEGGSRAVADLRALRGARTAVMVAVQPKATYRCIGGAIYLLQRAGFREVSFEGLAAAPS